MGLTKWCDDWLVYVQSERESEKMNDRTREICIFIRESKRTK